MSIHILVVEDEFIIAQHIRKHLEGYGYSVTHAFNATQAEERLKEVKPDLAMLDIRLSGKEDGISVAQTINERYGIPFIFLTSFSDAETLERAKSTRPSAYLTKPFKKADLYTSIEVALSNYAQENYPNQNEEIREHSYNHSPSSEEDHSLVIAEAVFVRSNRSLTKVNFSEITYLKSDRAYLEIYRKNKPKIVVRDSLNSYEQKLGKQFFRIHRSYVINLEHLETINTLDVEVDGEQLPTAKNFRDELTSRIRS